MVAFFISHRHLWHLGFISSLDEWTPSMEFQPQMLQENWVWHIKRDFPKNCVFSINFSCKITKLHRFLESPYKTAWKMGHKIRSAVVKQESVFIVEGIVQMDEMYLSHMGSKRQGRSGMATFFRTIFL